MKKEIRLQIHGDLRGSQSGGTLLLFDNCLHVFVHMKKEIVSKFQLSIFVTSSTAAVKKKKNGDGRRF
jgi:hypothetical protein